MKTKILASVFLAGCSHPSTVTPGIGVTSYPSTAKPNPDGRPRPAGPCTEQQALAGACDASLPTKVYPAASVSIQPKR